MTRIRKFYLVLTMTTVIFVSFGTLTKEAFAADGAKVFKKCKACHNFKKNKIGPNLKGVVDRKVASVEGFKYSKAMKRLGDNGIIWSEQELNKFLTKPKKYLKGTKMSFGGLKKEDQRKAVIDYMRNQ